jgi:hypothetical protein
LGRICGRFQGIATDVPTGRAWYGESEIAEHGLVLSSLVGHTAAPRPDSRHIRASRRLGVPEASKDCAASLFCLRRTPPHGARAWAVIAKRAVAARALHCVLRAIPLVYDMRMIVLVPAAEHGQRGAQVLAEHVTRAADIVKVALRVQ